jgi:1-acyl-sn-glycerol-3-phosphate acyltransferase
VRWARIAWKFPAAVVATAGMAVVPALARVLFAGRPRRIARVGALATSRWGRVMCAVLGVEVRVEGAVPRGGVFLVASNHLSYLDIFVLGSLYPSLFVAKREIAGWPVFGRVARIAGTLFVDREQARDVVRAGRLMAEHLHEGVPLTIFPEGKSTPGVEVLPFLPSLLEPAARAGVPCWAASLRYETPGEVLSPSVTVCWYDSSSFPAHFARLVGLKRIVATVRFAPTPLTSGDRKELARSLWREVRAGFEPIPA